MELQPPPKTTLFVQTIVLKMGEIDSIKERYNCEIVVRSRWQEPALLSVPEQGKMQEQVAALWNPKMYIDNAFGEVKTKAYYEVEQDAALGLFYVTEARNFRGTFIEALELGNFPFDVQELSLVIKADQPLETCEILDEPKALHKVHTKNFIDEQEYVLYKHVTSTLPYLNRDPELPGANRPSIKVTCYIARRPMYFFWTMFLVLFLLGVMAQLTFYNNIVAYCVNRLMTLGISISSTVLFKNSINAHLPKIPYLTFIDRYLLTTFLFLALLLFYNAAALTLFTYLLTLDEVYANDFVAEVVSIFIFVLYNVFYAFWIWRRPFGVRREMDRLQESYLRRSATMKADRDRNTYS